MNVKQSKENIACECPGCKRMRANEREMPSERKPTGTRSSTPPRKVTKGDVKKKKNNKKNKKNNNKQKINMAIGFVFGSLFLFLWVAAEVNYFVHYGEHTGYRYTVTGRMISWWREVYNNILHPIEIENSSNNNNNDDHVFREGTIAIGREAVAKGIKSYALGKDAVAKGADSFAFGRETVATSHNQKPDASPTKPDNTEITEEFLNNLMSEYRREVDKLQDTILNTFQRDEQQKSGFLSGYIFPFLWTAFLVGLGIVCKIVVDKYAECVSKKAIAMCQMVLTFVDSLTDLAKVCMIISLLFSLSCFLIAAIFCLIISLQ